MLKVEIDRKDGKAVGSCDLMGTERDIAYEVLQALGTIYSTMQGEFDARYLLAFRAYLTTAVLDPSSPVWTTRPAGGEKVVSRPPDGRGQK